MFARHLKRHVRQDRSPPLGRVRCRLESAERAADGPFGSTIAHGFLTLSLLPRMASELYAVESAGMIVNVGSDKVRFVAPVPVDSRVRAHGVITSRERRGEAVRNVFAITIELEGSDRPAAVVESINQIFPA